LAARFRGGSTSAGWISEFERETSQHGGLLVVRHGYLVYEKYFGRGNREAHPDTASIGKAFTSVSCGSRQEAEKFPTEGRCDRFAHGPPRRVSDARLHSQHRRDEQLPDLVRRRRWPYALPIRTQTVMAPQALFTMNNELVEKESEKLAALALKESSGDLQAAVDAAYRRTLGRKPSRAERDYALTSIEKDPALMKELAWLLFNLDEFLYVR
jgi:hypothetical protein